MKEYFVINVTGLSDFIIAVNKYMSQGWQPIGGVCVTNETQGDVPVRVYAQALVR